MIAVPSPCIRVCNIDHTVGLCMGCGRTLDEIGNWLRYSGLERRAIMDALPKRRERMAAGMPEPIFKQP